MLFDAPFYRDFAYKGLGPPLSHQADDLIMNRFKATFVK
jgi:hypothetical protein